MSGLKGLGGYEVSGLLLRNGWSDMFKGVLVIIVRILLLLMYSGESRGLFLYGMVGVTGKFDVSGACREDIDNSFVIV